MGTKRRHPPRETEAGDHQGASADQDLSALIEKLHAVGPSDTGPAAGSLGVNVLGRISGKTVDLLLVTVSNGWRVLTDRQIEIMRHAARGKGNQAIAKALGISRDTVRVHMRSILDRLGVRSRHLLPLVASALESALEDRTVPDGPSASKAPTVGSGTSGAAPPLRAGGKRRPIRAKGRHRAVAAEAAGDDE